MEQYKVILVDDEVEVIDVMKKKIRWNDLGFDVVGSATNGVKALELVEKLQPDVVLTDIKMPYMDGLELARKLNQDYPNIYIMLCTGFDEFEYAKEAVHLEIKEYMRYPYEKQLRPLLHKRAPLPHASGSTPARYSAGLSRKRECSAEKAHHRGAVFLFGNSSVRAYFCLLSCFALLSQL